MSEITAYPLTWPVGYKRTPDAYRTWSRFNQSYGKAQNFMRDEVQRLGGSNLIVSTNLRIRKDGMLYADELNRKIDDPGVAIYFQRKGKPVAMCADKYLRIWENMYALGKSIEAMRGMDRWGVSEMLDRAFTGFTALPDAIVTAAPNWWEVLGFDNNPGSICAVKARYYELVKQHHPDVGGDTKKIKLINWAYTEALKQLE